jgi:hypothetical protein
MKKIIDDDFIECLKESNKRQLEKDITNIIGYSIGLEKGERYKMNISLYELINYKWDKDSDNVFKMYVSTIVNLIELVKTRIPFIDMTGIDFQWTPKQILDYIIYNYYNVPTIKLK